MNPIDLTGQRFGKLVALSPARVLHGRRGWTCACDCGASTTVSTLNLRADKTKSCGCLRREACSAIAIEHNFRHGHNTTAHKTPTWNSWNAMLKRCRQPAHTSYSSYGGRGITVCERWLDFRAFLADMGERPDGRTLDRVNVNGNYEPSNCRWATRSEQQRNKRCHS